MANELDETRDVVNPQGRDTGVIEKQLPIKVGIGSTIFEIILWVLGIIPGLIFMIMKINAGKYLSQLQQKLQHDASTIDNYLEQRVVILENLAVLLDKAISLDKDTMTAIAQYRGGGSHVGTIFYGVDAKGYPQRIRQTIRCCYPYIRFIHSWSIISPTLRVLQGNASSKLRTIHNMHRIEFF